MELEEMFEGDEIDKGDDLGGDDSVPEPESVEAKVEETEAKTEAEPEETPPETEDDAEAKVETTTTQADVPIAALLDEREKRQKMERELESLKAQQAQQADSSIDPLEDFDAAFNQRASQLEAQMNARFIAMTENLVRSQHDDYDEMETRFLKEAETDPTLIEKMSVSPNPAEFAYRHAKTRYELEQAGDLDALREKIRQEERAAILKEQGKGQKVRDEVPDSLSEARAAGNRGEKAEAGPTPLDSILAS